jgi:tetratricopeptide (TPR) repeat protein
VAKINPVKLKQDADKLEKAGKLPEAIALYKQVIEDNPRDWNVINKVGDLYAKLNRFRDAAEQYAKVADFYARDGFHLKAIAIWKKINKLDATSLDPYLNLAELYGKQGLMMEAKSQYQYVVDEYIKRGKTREAGDVLKKMADIDPSDLKIRSKLADLYTREGNAGKAVEEHVAIADELTKKGHLAEALQVLEKGLKIDAKSSRLRLELGRIHLVQKNYDKAVSFLETAVEGAPGDPDIMGRLGEAYLGSKRIEEAEAVLKRLLEINPNDEDARVQMARVHLQQGQFDRAYAEMEPLVDKLVQRRDGDRAAGLLQHIVQKNPSHLKTLNRLVEIYQQSQKESSLLATYSQLTEAYINQGQLAEATSVLELLVAREPHNAQHKTKLQFVRGKIAGGGVPTPPPPPAPEPVEEDFDLSAADESTAPAPAPASIPIARVAAVAPATGSHRAMAAPAASAAATPARPVIEATGPLSEQDREFIDEHLAEGKVFRKYGLVDKSADQFEAVVARFPDNVEARQELREVYREKNLPAKAAEHCLALSEIFRLQGDATSARKFEEEAEQLVPGSGRPGAVPAAPAPAAVPARAAPPAPAAPAVEEEEFALDEEEIPLGEREEEVSRGAESGAPAAPAEASAVEEESLDLDQELASGHDLPSQFIDEEPLAPPAAEEVDIPFGLDEPVEEPAAPAPPARAAKGAPPPPAIAQEEEIGFGVEEEFPLDEAPAPAPAPREVKPAARPAPPAPSPPAARAGAAAAPARGAASAAARPAAPAPPPSAPPPPAPAAELRAAPLAAKPAPAAPAGGVPAELARVLEEVDSYVSLGFVDDAKEALREVSARFPGHPALAHKVAELGIEEAAEPVEAPPAIAAEPDLAAELGDLGLEAGAAYDPLSELGVEAPPPAEERGGAEDLLADVSGPAEPEAVYDETPAGEELLATGLETAVPAGEGIDLGSELGELFGAQSAVEEVVADAASTELGDAGLADIFKEFKKGVDKQLGKEDYDTRYNLGIAYKEMGLIDEAIAEFQLAAKDESRVLECSSMLGICFLEKGMPKLAIKWFERGLKAPGRTEEEYAALRYDLAVAHEAAGDADRALLLFTELYGQDANFRDVAAKVRELRSAVQG